MTRQLVESPSAEQRLDLAARFLAASTGRVLIVAATHEAAAEIARRALDLVPAKASLGWQRVTLPVLAATLAQEALAEQELAPVGRVALEAVCARIVSKETLGRFEPVSDKPGLPRALARTLSELRLAGSPKIADTDLARLNVAYEDALTQLRLADRARVLSLAPAADFDAILFLDVTTDSQLERDFVARLAAKDVLATLPLGDGRALALLQGALKVEATRMSPPPSPLARVQRALFSREAVEPSDALTILSAPGTNRECVEIARLIVREAERGTPLDRIAVLLRTMDYVPHLQEALRRASVPAFFARGVRLPDPSGRALLSLLLCAAEGLSALRFAEYLSLGETPALQNGAPPPPTPSSELAPAPAETAVADEADAPVNTVPTPRHWERLIVDASVIGGKDRWSARLNGLRQKLEQDREAYLRDDELARAEGVGRDLDALQALCKLALPLIEELSALPREGTWGEWLAKLEALATRAMRDPERVVALLRELAPMSEVPGVTLADVLLVLEPHLSTVLTAPSERRYGRVFVGSVDEARGMSFDVVCVAGLAEKIFPQKVVEDPLLLDAARAPLGLPTTADRAEQERLALRICVGAATRRLVLSYPRIDSEQGRPRTPSFYALEVLRASEGGALKDFEHLAQLAAGQTNARLGWPAPETPALAIDDAEYDLAVLSTLLRDPQSGAAHYLLNVNAHLQRALRFRGRRWFKEWKQSDGVVSPAAEALTALQAHGMAQRSYSATALQHYAACPYRFYLSAIQRLQPQERPAPIEELDPMTRGSLVHETQFELLQQLRAEGKLPLREVPHAQLDQTLARVAQRYREKLAPAITRVWDDAIVGIAADLREWLRRMSEEHVWTPVYFELSFGMAEPRVEDDASQLEPLALDNGLKLRGSIDLVERATDGSLRAVDYKTGKNRASADTVVGGGEILQPVLYALALEKRFPDARVDSGVLYYCTQKADFAVHRVPLDSVARHSAGAVVKSVQTAVQNGFLPAAPAKGACRFCDYRPVCGPNEELRTKRKPALADLVKLRELP